MTLTDLAEDTGRLRSFSDEGGLRLEVLKPLKEDTTRELEVVDHAFLLLLKSRHLLSQVLDLSLLRFNDLLQFLRTLEVFGRLTGVYEALTRCLRHFSLLRV